MEFGTIEREIHVDATPEVVFEVVSRPEHISQWWSDDAALDPTPGAVGELSWGDGAQVEHIKVINSDPPRLFAFRWCYPDGDTAVEDSLLITFELTPVAGGTRIRLVETGFREMGWEAAKLEEVYADHVQGWDQFVPALGAYIEQLVAAS